MENVLGDKQAGMGAEQGSSGDVNRVPVEIAKTIIRKPVDRELLAHLVATRQANEREKELFYRIIKSLIYSHAYRFGNCHDYNITIDDIAADCYQHVLSVLDQYDSRIAALSTWLWTTVQNFFFTKRKKIFRHKHTHVLNPNMATSYGDRAVCGENHTRAVSMNLDLRDVVRDLIQENPEHKDFLIAALGNPFKTPYVPTTSVCLKQINATIGGNYVQQWKFWKNVVKPTLMRRMG